MADRPLPNWLVVAAVGLLAAVLAWKTLDPVYDPDTWWHLRVGEWVAENRAVPVVDPFSRMSRETPTEWVAYSWLYELGLWSAESGYEGRGVYLARAILVGLSTATVVGFVVWRVGPTVLGLTVAAAATATLLPLTAERPWHVTIAFTAVTIAAVTALRNGRSVRRVWWLPLLYVIWASVHIQFVLGWGVLGLACLFPGAAKRSHLIGLTVACGVAVLVNPYHVCLFPVIWEYATQAQALRLVSELRPPEWSNPVTWAVAGLLVLALSRATRTRPVDWFAVGLLAAGAFFALRMQRDLWFGVLAAATALGGKEDGRRAAYFGIGLIVAAFAVSAFIPREGDRQSAHYPVHAVRYVREQSPPGPLFNHFNWGGYLIRALPDYPVSIDGRTNLYGNDRVLRNYRSLTGEPDWADDPDLTSANLAILPADCPLAGLMRSSRDWKVTFEDETAVVFRRLR